MVLLSLLLKAVQRKTRRKWKFAGGGGTFGTTVSPFVPSGPRTMSAKSSPMSRIRENRRGDDREDRLLASAAGRGLANSLTREGGRCLNRTGPMTAPWPAHLYLAGGVLQFSGI